MMINQIHQKISTIELSFNFIDNKNNIIYDENMKMNNSTILWNDKNKSYLLLLNYKQKFTKLYQPM